MRVIILKVRVSIFVLDIPEVKDLNARCNLMFWYHDNCCRNGMEITVDFYFRQFWNDNRLRLDSEVVNCSFDGLERKD